MAGKKRSYKDNMLLIDALAESVYQGRAGDLEAGVLYGELDAWKTNCSMNAEYLFARHPEFDLSTLEIDWRHLDDASLRRAVEPAIRAQQILDGSPLTPDEQHAYRVELARQKHGYKTAADCLESEVDCKWVDLRYVTDSKGREVYIMLLGDPVELDEDDMDSHQEVWNWLDQCLEVLGPFRSQEEAEDWMVANGAYEEL